MLCETEVYTLCSLLIKPAGSNPSLNGGLTPFCTLTCASCEMTCAITCASGCTSCAPTCADETV
jgi:hypothetical protein